MTENEISYIIRKAIFNVYNGLGPVLPESIYHKILIYELEDLGIDVRSEVSIPLIYNDITFNCEFRIDILVENKVIVEVKSVKDFENIHFK